MPVTSRPRTTLDPTRPRSWRMRRGMMGFSILDSRAMKRAMSTAATAPNPSTWDEPQPWLVAWTIAYTAVINDTVTRTEPSQSTPCSRPMPRSSGMRMRPKVIAARPIGRLTKKIQCQLSASVSAPPARRPSEPPATAVNTYALMARARSCGWGNSVTMMARITEACMAAPMPWTKRAAMRKPWLGAAPHSTEAAVKMTSPARNTRLRPSRSPSRPASSRKLPKVTRKALTTQVRLPWLKCRSCWIDGNATFTIVVSSTIMSWARQTTTRAIHRRSLVGMDVGVGVRFIRPKSCGAGWVGGKLEGTSRTKWRQPPVTIAEAPSVLSSESF